MELIVLDTSLKMLSVLDTFESLIWTERYSAYGDFEVYTSINDSILEILKDDYYLWLKESDQTMIVEDRKIESDAENGNHFTVTGRSLESILERRIIWKQTILSGNFQNGIKKLLDENIINPSDASRKVERLIFEASTDPAITGLTVDAQFTGDNLYDAIKKLCDSKNIGFRIKLSDDNKFVFKLYAGEDHSYDQFTNPYVIFSPKFENVINTNYLESKKTLKTVTLVAGEGEGADRKTTTVACSSGAGTGLNRRELYTDASMNATNITTGGYVGSEMYKKNLAQAKTLAASAFGNLILSHREYLTNAVTEGYPSGGAWFDSTLELPNEIMMYGSHVFAPAGDGKMVPNRYTVGKTQLALFTVVPKFISNRATFWLRDVVSSAHFAVVDDNGRASSAGASDSRGVRPVFPIG